MEVQLTKSKRREAHLSSFVENIGASYKVNLHNICTYRHCLANQLNTVHMAHNFCIKYNCIYTVYKF